MESTSAMHQELPHRERKRPLIAFFDYSDVYEDFYPHYGVSQHEFATRWHNTANHAWLAIIQKEIGDVLWYCNSIRPEVDEEIHEFIGCRVKFVPSSWLHRLLWKAFYLPACAWRWRRFYRGYALVASYLAPFSWSLFNSLRRERPDILYVQDYCSGRYDVLLLFAKLLNIPCLTFHSGSTSDKYLGKALRPLTIRQADWIFPSGNNELKLLEQKFGVPASRQSIIRPPIDTDLYRPMDRREACARYHLDADKRYFIFVGRLDDSVKRLSAIIEVFAGLCRDNSQFDLLIVGNGQDETSLKHQANDLIPGRVHFLGWIAEDHEKALALNTADCLLLASWREASPAVIGEAFACGVPVISSKVGCIDDLVIDDTTGWLFPAGDDEGLRQRLAHVMNDPEIITPMRKTVRDAAVRTVSIQAVSKALGEGFNRFL
jgi:glycosyltransferase involved in cell wall biosynthesis